MIDRQAYEAALLDSGYQPGQLVVDIGGQLSPMGLINFIEVAPGKMDWSQFVSVYNQLAADRVIMTQKPKVTVEDLGRILPQALNGHGWLIVPTDFELKEVMVSPEFIPHDEFTEWPEYTGRFDFYKRVSDTFKDRVNKPYIVDHFGWRAGLRLARSINDHYSMSEHQQQVLFNIAKKLAPGNLIVELGVAYGKTSAVLAYAARSTEGEMVGVDDFGLVGSPEDFSRRMKALNLSVILVVSKTNEVKWDRPIDLLVIDAGHDEENVKQDVIKWVPWVKQGGFVAFHDYPDVQDRQGPHAGVKRQADKATGDWEMITYESGLMVRRRIV